MKWNCQTAYIKGDGWCINEETLMKEVRIYTQFGRDGNGSKLF